MGIYIIFSRRGTVNPYNQLLCRTKQSPAWDYLYSEWLQNSVFEYTDEPYYEEYILKNGNSVKLKLYLLIRERKEETKITTKKAQKKSSEITINRKILFHYDDSQIRKLLFTALASCEF